MRSRCSRHLTRLRSEMPLSEAAHRLLHVHGLDGAHPLPLAVFPSDFSVDAKRKEAWLLQVLAPERTGHFTPFRLTSLKCEREGRAPSYLNSSSEKSNLSLPFIPNATEGDKKESLRRLARQVAVRSYCLFADPDLRVMA